MAAHGSNSVLTWIHSTLKCTLLFHFSGNGLLKGCRTRNGVDRGGHDFNALSRSPGLSLTKAIRPEPLRPLRIPRRTCRDTQWGPGAETTRERKGERRTRCLSHFDSIETGGAARVAEVGLGRGTGRGQRQAGARLGQVDGDVAEVARLGLFALRVAPVQVELVLADGHVPNVLRQRLRLAEPHDHADRRRLERAPTSSSSSSSAAAANLSAPESGKKLGSVK